MRLITGDECGLLKECIPELSSNPKNKPRRDDDDEDDDAAGRVAPNNAMPHVSLDGIRRIDPKETQTRQRGVVDMAFLSDDDQLSFAALRQNGSIQLWEGSTESTKKFGKYHILYETKKSNLFEEKGLDKSVSTSTTPPWKPLALGVFAKESRLCSGDSHGNVTLLNLKDGSVVDTYNAYTSSKRGSTISYTPGKNLNSQLATAMACDPLHRRVAIGGRERETTILDLATGKVVFKAKNLPPDPQTLLQHPVWPTSILFLQDGNTMAVGTAYKELRLYDVRESSKMRRPIAKTTAEGGPIEYRVTTMCQVHEHELAVGDGAGYIYSIDMRTLGKGNSLPSNSNNMGRYVGPAGSVRQLKKHPCAPRMAAVGLDRMLRVYDTNNRKQIDCFYLKQRLNCVLFAKDDDWRPGSSRDDDKDDDDDQDIDQDDVVQDYVDSEDEEHDKIQSEDESTARSEVEDSASEGSDDKDHDQEEPDEEVSDERSESSKGSDSDDPEDEDSDAQGSISASNNKEEISVHSDDEEIVIRAPKKKQRRR